MAGVTIAHNSSCKPNKGAVYRVLQLTASDTAVVRSRYSSSVRFKELSPGLAENYWLWRRSSNTHVVIDYGFNLLGCSAQNFHHLHFLESREYMRVLIESFTFAPNEVK